MRAAFQECLLRCMRGVAGKLQRMSEKSQNGCGPGADGLSLTCSEMWVVASSLLSDNASGGCALVTISKLM